MISGPGESVVRSHTSCQPFSTHLLAMHVLFRSAAVGSRKVVTEESQVYIRLEPHQLP